MSDSTMNDIKSGKGLSPLQGATQSAPKQSGVTTEQRAEHGVTHETFTKNDGKSDGK